MISCSSKHLKAGMDYTNLKKVIVVMILPFDPFGFDQIVYTIQNTCLEVPELPYDDGAKSIFLYTKGTKGNATQSLRDLLHYMEKPIEENVTNEKLRKIHDMVTMVKQNVEVSREFMKWFEIQQMWEEEGIEKGQQLEFCGIVRKLFSKGKTAEEIANLLDKELSEIEKIIKDECEK